SEKTITCLIKAFQQAPSPAVRTNAAKSLGGIGLEEAIPALINALSDEEDSVRLSATDAIGKIGSNYAKI
ncbi:MAG: HEAT repeat domain-containing protein, partial [Microcystis panniformis]